MDTQAAILWEPHTEWSVEDIELDPPKAGEVLVKLAASGLCHSDEHLVTGDMVLPPEVAAELGLQQFPIIGGHEGAGEVVEVGAGRHRRSQPGDHVVLGFIPSCGRCPSCAMGQPEPVRPRRVPARRPPGHRLHGPPPRQGRQRPRHHVLPRHVLRRTRS